MAYEIIHQYITVNVRPEPKKKTANQPWWNPELQKPGGSETFERQKISPVDSVGTLGGSSAFGFGSDLGVAAWVWWIFGIWTQNSEEVGVVFVQKCWGRMKVNITDTWIF